MMSTGPELQNKGIRLFEKGKFAESAELFVEAIETYGQEGDEKKVAEMRVNLGLAKREQGDYEAAIGEMQTGLAYFQEHQERLLEAQALGNMALTYLRAEDPEQAETMYREAARIFRELKENQFYGETIFALGDMLFRSGKLLEALAVFEIGLENVRDKSQRQKIMKNLLVLKNRIMGEERTTTQSSNDEPTSDLRRRRLFSRKSQKQKADDSN